MSQVKVGSYWSAVNGTEFRVIDVVEAAGNTWVHYIGVDTGLEYSCWVESFVHRFREEHNRGS